LNRHAVIVVVSAIAISSLTRRCAVLAQAQRVVPFAYGSLASPTRVQRLAARVLADEGDEPPKEAPARPGALRDARHLARDGIRTAHRRLCTDPEPPCAGGLPRSVRQWPRAPTATLTLGR